MKTDAVYNKEAKEQMETLTFNCINMTQRDEAFVLINIKLPNQNGIHKLRLKIDTGAQGNTLPLSTFRRMFPEKLDTDGFPSIKNQFINKELIAYNGTPIKCFGNIKIPGQYNKSDWHVSTFHILDVQGPAVLGLPSLEQLKLITLHCAVKKEDAFQTPVATRINATKDLMQMYPDQFDKIGSMPGAVRLSVNKNIHPHIDAPRESPTALKDYIEQELDNMVKNKIIRKVTEPTDWVSSLTYSHKKDGSLRIYLDPRHLNTALRRPHHATPTIEEISQVPRYSLNLTPKQVIGLYISTLNRNC